MAPADTAQESVTDRLRRLQAAEGYADNAAAFARLHGFTPQQWSNFELRGGLPRDAAIKLVRRIPGLTLDWLYFGYTNGLSGEMARKLDDAPARRSA